MWTVSSQTVDVSRARTHRRHVLVSRSDPGAAAARGAAPDADPPGGRAMIGASFQSLLQGFFTERLLRQRQASPHTNAGYRDTFRLLLRFAADQLGKAPSLVKTGGLGPAFVGGVFGHLGQG